MIRFLSLAFLCSISSAENLPVVNLNTQDAFVSEIDAVKAALIIAIPESKDVEYGGVIEHCQDKYFYTLPITQNNSKHVNYNVRAEKKCRIVALYHTHPIQLDRHFESIDPRLASTGDRFSEEDIKTFKRLNIDSFIGVYADHSVRVLEANISHVSDTGYNIGLLF